MLECRDVSFAYGSRLVLDGFSFQAGRGIIGLLGPNGAGKSTLLNVLATVRRPRSGTVLYDGVASERAQLNRVRRRLGFLPQRFDLMSGSTCQANVAYAAWCHGVDAARCDRAAADALAMVNLSARADARVGTLSGGQRQRVGVACAIAHSPDIVLLDEPTVGLDPAQRIDLRNHLSAIAETACVVVSTHLVEDLVAMTADVIVINRGRKVFQGGLGEMVPARAVLDTAAVEAAYLSLVGGVEE